MDARCNTKHQQDRSYVVCLARQQLYDDQIQFWPYVIHTALHFCVFFDPELDMTSLVARVSRVSYNLQRLRAVRRGPLGQNVTHSPLSFSVHFVFDRTIAMPSQPTC